MSRTISVWNTGIDNEFKIHFNWSNPDVQIKIIQDELNKEYKTLNFNIEMDDFDMYYENYKLSESAYVLTSKHKTTIQSPVMLRNKIRKIIKNKKGPFSNYKTKYKVISK